MPERRARSTSTPTRRPRQGEAHPPHRRAQRLAPCDVRRRVAEGATWTEATARIASGAAAEARGIEALRAKYGWQMWLLLAGAKLGGRWRAIAACSRSSLAGA
ncbi:MAG: hypothetical protein MZV70_45290 [Desulfobacterales bacterium]|nr:hypothetical protein [Desulfobacterales bacterium]